MFIRSAAQVGKAVVSKAVDQLNVFGCVKDALVNAKECNGKIHDFGGIMALVLVKQMSSSSWFIASGGCDCKIKVCAHSKLLIKTSYPSVILTKNRPEIFDILLVCVEFLDVFIRYGL